MPPEVSQQQSAPKGARTLLAVVAIGIIAILGFFGYRVMKKPADEMASTESAPNSAGSVESKPAEPAPSEMVSSGQKYANGTYTAIGTYPIPNGKLEEIRVTLTLTDGVVTDVNYTSNPEEKGSIANQAKFSAGYKAEVVGKNIDEINLTVVNGSSLTPMGFMDALKQVKQQASEKAAAI